MNYLCYGDNLDILREYVRDESVDLIYLDPPFNSNQSYNILFQEKNGTKSSAQIQAFEDTWHWDLTAEEIWTEIVEKSSNRKLADLMIAMTKFLGRNDMMAYLVMMAIRLQELHRVLKSTGSIYLHCDPTASHYLKLVMDAVFGHRNFANEIVWQRSTAHNISTKGYVRVNDVLLFFMRSTDALFNQLYTEYGPQQMKRYRRDETGRLYKAENLTFSTATQKRQFEWRGAKLPGNRSWGASLEQLEKWYERGRILLKRDGTPRLDGLKVYLDEMPGNPVTTNWTDIPRIGNTSKERLGYPTQKPEVLLERIIKASSNEGDTVLDPFCGCGTTITVAERLKRRWVGIDITHLAVALMEYRLRDTFGDSVEYEVVGVPASVKDAEDLAKRDPFQFQSWVLSLVKAKPEPTKVADRGIDGRIYFHDDPEHTETKEIIIQVKGGRHVNPGMIDALKGVVEKEKAHMGVFITLQKPTKGMVKEAVSSGFYKSPIGKQYSKIQILTIEELFDGRDIQRPPEGIAAVDRTFRKAKKHKEKQGKQREMFHGRNGEK